MRWWFGRGRGWRFGGYGAPWCPWSFKRGRGFWWRRAGYYPYTGITKEEEKEYLEAWKKELELELEDVKKRLEELR